MDNQRQEDVIRALTSHGVKLSCPRCGNERFEFIGESVIPLNEQPGIAVASSSAIPVVLVACTMCGYITQHAQGPLNLLGGQNE